MNFFASQRVLSPEITRSFVGGSDAFGTFSEIDRQTYWYGKRLHRLVGRTMTRKKSPKRRSVRKKTQSARTKEIISEGDVDFRYYFNQRISGLIIHH